MKLILIVMFLGVNVLFAQTDSKYACYDNDNLKIEEHHEKVAEFAKLHAKCRNEHITNDRLRLFNFDLGNCEWANNGCPLSLVLPRVSDSVRRLQIFGRVTVEIIVDESGKVISAQALNGHRFFRGSAQKAACDSKFSPRSYCGHPVMEKRTIRYLFLRE